MSPSMQENEGMIARWPFEKDAEERTGTGFNATVHGVRICKRGFSP